MWLATEMCSLFQELVNSMFFCNTKMHTAFAEKKGNCNAERVNTDKHNHKNNNNKTLNNFEILCQQTWLNRLCHTFDANEWLQWQWRCVCIVHFIEVQIAFYWLLTSVRARLVSWLAGWLASWIACAFEWAVCVSVVLSHFSFLRMRKKRRSATRERRWAMVRVSLACYLLITIISWCVKLL